MSKSRRERTDIAGATAVEEPTTQSQDVGSSNGAGTEAPNEPSLLPVQQNGDGNGERKPKREETKYQRFRRLGNMRLPKALKAIRALIPLANKSQYGSGLEERTILVDALTRAVEEVKSAFTETSFQQPAAIYFR